MSDGQTFIRAAVLTVSDTRTPETDTSGKFLADALRETGHTVTAHEIVIDDVYLLRAKVSAWIVDPEVDIIITTGGTGFGGRDSTPEALSRAVSVTGVWLVINNSPCLKNCGVA